MVIGSWRLEVLQSEILRGNTNKVRKREEV